VYYDAGEGSKGVRALVLKAATSSIFVPRFAGGRDRGPLNFSWLQKQAVALESAAAETGMPDPPRNFAEFWPHYVLAHSQPVTRVFHASGTILGWALVACAITFHRYWLVIAALAVPYMFAWFSHFFIQHNWPASFVHPVWSLLADQKMLALSMAGKMGEEVRRCAGEP
jgi:hypothetical protein